MVIHIITKFFIVRGNFRKSALMILTFTFSFWSLISEISSITNHMMGNFFEMLYINVKIFCNYFIYCNITLISLYCNNLLVIYTYLFLLYPVLERFFPGAGPTCLHQKGCKSCLLFWYDINPGILYQLLYYRFVLNYWN